MTPAVPRFAYARAPARRPPPGPAPEPGAGPGRSIEAYRGLGSWVDIYDERAWKNPAAAVADIEAQLKRLMGRNFIAETPFERLQHYPRYFKGIQVRLDKLKTNPARDAQLMADYAPLWTNYERRAIQLAKLGAADPQIEQFRWLLEELRISLFAQELRTPVPVSVKRLQKQWEGIQYG